MKEISSLFCNDHVIDKRNLPHKDFFLSINEGNFFFCAMIMTKEPPPPKLPVIITAEVVFEALI